MMLYFYTNCFVIFYNQAKIFRVSFVLSKVLFISKPIITETDIIPYGYSTTIFRWQFFYYIYDFLYVYLVISFVTCVFSDRFAKGVRQVHVLLKSCYFHLDGNYMPYVSYITYCILLWVGLLDIQLSSEKSFWKMRHIFEYRWLNSDKRLRLYNFWIQTVSTVVRNILTRRLVSVV